MHSIFKSQSPREFEAWCCNLYSLKFGGRGELTPKGPDGGIDARIYTTNETIIIQCKNWGSKVGSKTVHEFNSVLETNQSRYGIIACPSGFSKNAKILVSNIRTRKIELHDERELLKIKKKIESAHGTLNNHPKETQGYFPDWVYQKPGLSILNLSALGIFLIFVLCLVLYNVNLEKDKLKNQENKIDFTIGNSENVKKQTSQGFTDSFFSTGDLTNNNDLPISQNALLKNKLKIESNKEKLESIKKELFDLEKLLQFQTDTDKIKPEKKLTSLADTYRDLFLETRKLEEEIGNETRETNFNKK